MISCPWFSWRGWHNRDLGALLSGEEQLVQPSRPGSSCLGLSGDIGGHFVNLCVFSHRGLFLFSQRLKP